MFNIAFSYSGQGRWYVGGTVNGERKMASFDSVDAALEYIHGLVLAVTPSDEATSDPD